MFEKASRKKLRFSTSRGLLSVEDIWDLPLSGLVSLDAIAMALNKELESNSSKSFVTNRKNISSDTKLRFKIAKYIIGVKLDESDKRKIATENKLQKQKIAEIINDKEDGALAEKSIEELKKLHRGL